MYRAQRNSRSLRRQLTRRDDALGDIEGRWNRVWTPVLDPFRRGLGYRVRLSDGARPNLSLPLVPLVVVVVAQALDIGDARASPIISRDDASLAIGNVIFADSAAPRCANCAHRAAAKKCVRCGGIRPVSTRDGAGEPLCYNCSRRRESCCRCQRVLPVTARIDDADRCAGRALITNRRCIGPVANAAQWRGCITMACATDAQPRKPSSWH